MQCCCCIETEKTVNFKVDVLNDNAAILSKPRLSLISSFLSSKLPYLLSNAVFFSLLVFFSPSLQKDHYTTLQSHIRRTWGGTLSPERIHIISWLTQRCRAAPFKWTQTGQHLAGWCILPSRRFCCKYQEQSSHYPSVHHLNGNMDTFNGGIVTQHAQELWGMSSYMRYKSYCTFFWVTWPCFNILWQVMQSTAKWDSHCRVILSSQMLH